MTAPCSCSCSRIHSPVRLSAGGPRGSRPRRAHTRLSVSSAPRLRAQCATTGRPQVRGCKAGVLLECLLVVARVGGRRTARGAAPTRVAVLVPGSVRAGYYFRAGLVPTQFVIHLQGGWYCFDANTCGARYAVRAHRGAPRADAPWSPALTHQPPPLVRRRPRP